MYVKNPLCGRAYVWNTTFMHQLSKHRMISRIQLLKFGWNRDFTGWVGVLGSWRNDLARNDTMSFELENKQRSIADACCFGRIIYSLNHFQYQKKETYTNGIDNFRNIGFFLGIIGLFLYLNYFHTYGKNK